MCIKRIIGVCWAVMSVISLLPATQIVSASATHIYSTDFDSYTVGEAASVTQTLVDLSVPYGSWRWNNPMTGVVGEVHDAEHGTSMKFVAGDYKHSYVQLPKAYTEQVLISFDYLATGSCTMYVSEGENQNFFTTLASRDAKSEISTGATVSYTKNVQPEYGTWMRVEIYVDIPNERFAFYIDGNPVDAPHAFYGSKKSLNAIWFWKRSGAEVFVDNVLIQEVERSPHFAPIDVSIPNSVVSSSATSVTLNFSDHIDASLLTEDNIYVEDVTNGRWLSGVSLSDANSRSVKVNFGSALESETEYRVHIGNVVGCLGQPLTSNYIDFYVAGEEVSGNGSVLYETNFDGFVNGASGYPQWTFLNAATKNTVEGGNYQATGYAIGAQKDEAHGTSLKLVDEYADCGKNLTVNGSIALSAKTAGKVLVSLEYCADEIAEMGGGSSLSFSNNNAENVVSVSKNGAKLNALPDGSYTSILLDYEQWNLLEIFFDYDAGMYTAYVNGKTFGPPKKLMGTEMSSLSFITWVTYTPSHSNLWIDNLSIASVDYEPHTQPITLSLSAPGNALPEGADSVYLKFSDLMDASLLGKGNIFVEEMTESEVKPVAVSFSEATSKQIKINFGSVLNETSAYRIRLSDTLKGVAGNALAQEYISFYPYSAGAKVNGVRFKDLFGNFYEYGKVKPEITELTVAFNRAVDVAAAKNAIHLYDADGTEVEIDVSYTSFTNTARVKPTQMLAGNSLYTLYVDEGVLNSAYSRKFETLAGMFATYGIKVEHSGDLTAGSVVGVSATLINTVCAQRKYTILVGEYKNGKLVGYATYRDLLPAEVRSLTVTKNVTLRSNCDTVKAFVWETPEQVKPIHKAEVL
ncbi:hypothetical protein FACS189492_0900 [Clostridia bacterium]|nr:hypothetical protein FACS189492_0900 [Clostridia bacterium]